ncbi:MAG: hypothetical protein M3014_01310, partial [Chloroflexota bacterium]|nr:hypothetical protein [Chloroflexota bacterium]
MSNPGEKQKKPGKLSAWGASLMLLGLVPGPGLPLFVVPGGGPPTAAAQSERTLPAQATLASLPLSFEPNEGQSPAPARFVAHTPDGALIFSPGEVTLNLRAPGAEQ